MTVPEDSVIVGNDVVIKCNIPSFITDFLSVVGWVNSEGSEFHSSSEAGKALLAVQLIDITFLSLEDYSQT